MDLRTKIPVGSTVYTVRVGKSRSYLLLCCIDGEIVDITMDAVRVVRGKSAELFRVRGGNYSDCVEALSMALYNKWDALKSESLL